jgi:hypothetical protein
MINPKNEKEKLNNLTILELDLIEDIQDAKKNEIENKLKENKIKYIKTYIFNLVKNKNKNLKKNI